MNRKQLLILVVLGALFAGIGIYYAKRERETFSISATRMGAKFIADFPLNDVSQITIKQPQGELNVIKKDDAWTVRERSDYPANFSEISELLRKVWDLKVTQPVKVGSAASLPRLELLTPDQGTNAGTLVEFKGKDGKVLQSLLLGKKHMRESPSNSQFGGGGWPDGRYVMVGNDLQSVALVSESFNNVEIKPESWLNKDFIKVEKIKSVSVVSTNATNAWHVLRETDSGEWKLADAKEGEKLDSGKVSSLSYALSSATFVDVVSPTNKPEDLGMDKPLVATIDTFDNLTYTVKMGKKTNDDNYYFTVALNGEPPKERTPGKDEKPEDKARLDKEFKEKVDKLAEKIKQERGYQKYTYLVSKWTIDPFLKERKDLLEEKKPEAKKDEQQKQDEPKKDDTKAEEPKKEDKPDAEKPAVDKPEADKAPPKLGVK
jgi:hypothetical protein